MYRSHPLWLLAVFYALLLGASCDKVNNVKKDELPPITTEGKNTFGCKVNGKVFRNFGRNFNRLDLIMQYHIPSGLFNLVGRQISSDEDIKSNIVGCLTYFTEEGMHTIREGDFYHEDFGHCADPYHNTFELDTTLPAILNILRLDNQEFIIAGTFGFTLVNPHCPGDTIRITEGRFDVDWAN